MKRGKFRGYLAVFTLFFLLILEDLILIEIMSLIFGKDFFPNFTHSRLPRFQATTYVSLLYFIALFTIIGFWKVYSGESIKSTGLSLRKGSFREFVTGILFGLGAIALFFVPLIFIKITHNAPMSSVWQKIMTEEFWSHIALNCLVCLAMAFTEELMFRGVILHVFLKSVPGTHALIAANAFFAVIHMFFPAPWSMKAVYFITLILFGIALSTSVLKTGRLWGAMGIHFTLMLFIIIRGYLGILELPRGPFEFLYGLTSHPMAGLWSITVFGCLAYVIRKTRPSDDQVPPPPPRSRQSLT